MATAGILSFATFFISSGMRMAPSRKEFSVCRWRWAKESDMAARRGYRERSEVANRAWHPTRISGDLPLETKAPDHPDEGMEVGPGQEARTPALATIQPTAIHWVIPSRLRGTRRTAKPTERKMQLGWIRSILPASRAHREGSPNLSSVPRYSPKNPPIPSARRWRPRWPAEMSESNATERTRNRSRVHRRQPAAGMTRILYSRIR